MESDTSTQKQRGILSTRVTFLELCKTPLPLISDSAKRLFVAGEEGVVLIRAENCPIHFYRYLYECVGRPHHWSDRRGLSDAKLAEILRAPTTNLYVLYCAGCPAGFAEVAFHDKQPQSVCAELIYFGLMKEYQGLGLGRLFLHNILQKTWAAGIDKMCVQTNTLDSPRALQLYQQAGFVVTAIKNAEIEAWE